MADNYQKTSPSDVFSPNLLAHPFKALDGLKFISADDYAESPLYLNHCRYFDVENALAAAGRFPGHRRRYLMLYLFSSSPGRHFPREHADALDAIFPVLFAVWQYRLGFLCSETLMARVQLLGEFRYSVRRLQLIKLVVKNPLGSCKDYAREMGCSERTIEHQLNALYDRLKIGGYNKNKKIEIYRRFQFLDS